MAIFFIFLYTIVMIVKTKQIPSSISETYYMGGGVWFTITLFISMFLLGSGLFELSEGSNWQFLSFITAAGMGFVGAAPQFHDIEKTMHYSGAITLITGSQLWLIVFSNPIVLFIWLSSILWTRSEKMMFWCEITALLSMVIGMFFI